MSESYEARLAESAARQLESHRRSLADADRELEKAEVAAELAAASAREAGSKVEVNRLLGEAGRYRTVAARVRARRDGFLASIEVEAARIERLRAIARAAENAISSAVDSTAVPAAAPLASPAPIAAVSGAPPTAVVLWAHSDESWSADDARTWQQTVLGFVELLRTAGGIDADLDLFHASGPTDWSRFGERAISRSQYVIVAVSPAWMRAFEGDNPTDANPGAAWEINFLRGMWMRDQRAFLDRVILVVLPGRAEADVPTALVAVVNWFRVAELTPIGIEPVVRRITDQPLDLPPQPGPIPMLRPRTSTQDDCQPASD